MRKLIIILVILAAVAAGGGYLGVRKYKSWRHEHAVRSAKEFLAKGDANNGLLWVRKALNSNPLDKEACAMMAEVAELTHSPSAVFWRNRLVELEPRSVANRVALARVAITSGDLAAAVKALEGVDAEGRAQLPFQRTYAALAIALGDFARAETHFSAALAIEPGNPVLQLNLAMVRLHSADSARVAEARKTLEELAPNPEVRVEALRQLALDGLRTTNYSRALEHAEELAREPRKTFSDVLLSLDALKAAKSAELPARLGAIQEGCGTNVAQVFELSRWMLTGTSPELALTWIRTLPEEIGTNMPCALVVADALVGTTNWTELQSFTEQQRWGDLEYLRFSYRSRAMRGLRLDEIANTEWARALKAAEGRLDRLVALQRVTAAWRWTAQLEDVLWVIVNRYTPDRQVVEHLAALLHAGGRTRSLLNLYARQAEAEPSNLSAKNNLAVLALLLNAVEHRPHVLAREVFESSPNNPFHASTYAYSLVMQKKSEEALEVLRRLPEEQLRRPEISGYYGLALRAAGQVEAAQEYFQLAAKAELLPEEAELFGKPRT